MNAIGSPAQPGPSAGAPSIDDRRDWLRLAGGLMFGSGALVLLVRKGQTWSDWAIVFALLVPAAVLLGLAIAGRAPTGRAGWRASFLVFGTLLLLGSLLEIVNALKGRPQADLNLAWTFGVAGAVAVATSLALRAQVQMLVGALLGVVAWLALWDKILTHPSGDTVRWLLIVLAAVYLVAALILTRAGRAEAADLITVAGIAAVLSAALSFAAAAGGVLSATGSTAAPGLSGNVPKPGQGWNLFLLVISLLLIAYGSRGRTRGPGYVGAVGLAVFILLTGADLVNRLNGQGGGVVGWPLILLIGGGAVLLLSFVLKPGALGGAGGSAAPPPGGPGVGAGYGQPWAATQPGAPGYGQPPGAAQPPPAQPPQAPPGQPESPLEQWRQQPPPGAGPPPQP
jgi:hypothetical protein